MKRIVLSALALGAMTTAAAAEPQALSEDRLAGVAAGFASVAQDITQWQAAHGLALNLGHFGGTADVDINQNQTAMNTASVNVTETVTKVVEPAPKAPEVPKVPICGGCFFPLPLK